MTANLRSFSFEECPLVVPGAADGLSARLIEAHGYECVYVGSYATAASRFAMPDTGRLSLEQLAAHARSISTVVDHTGAGKHIDGPQTLYPVEEAAERIRAAVAARTNPEFLLTARSDAFWVHRDLDERIARLEFQSRSWW